MNQKKVKNVTYKLIQQYVEEKYGFKVYIAYISEVKQSIGLKMYDASNEVEVLKSPRQHPTERQVNVIKEALRYYEVIK